MMCAAGKDGRSRPFTAKLQQSANQISGGVACGTAVAGAGGAWPACGRAAPGAELAASAPPGV